MELPSSRTLWLTAIVGTLLMVNQGASAFSTPQRSVLKMQSSLLDKIPNPFAGKPSMPSAPMMPKPDKFSPTPDGLVLRAKAVLAADFGVLDESLLDDSFVWVGPTLGSKVLGKADFLAAGKYFDLRAAFPDLDYRPHDFRIDENDPMTIRLTTRTVGSMRGELRLRNEIIPPKGVRMVCPPEAVTMTFDEKTGKLTKLCSGFTMDRLVGNTGGLCGVMGAATVAGAPPSEWEVFPATKVVQRFFGRPVQQLEEPSTFLAPFPETVMVQLAKGIISADMAASDPDLLGVSFTFCTPFDGPVDKNKYIGSYAEKVLGDSQPELTNFRVDPYDPNRVWVDVCPVGGAPQAMSFTFDDDGFCTRLTSWAVMDPSVGNSGGLGGEAGVQYASGSAPPGLSSRPLPQVLGRLQKRLFQIATKVGVDEYRLEGTAPEPKPVAPKSPPPKTQPQPFFAGPKTPAAPRVKEQAMDRNAEAQAAAAARRAEAAEAAAARRAQVEAEAAERKAMLEQAAAERKMKAEQAAAAQRAQAEQFAAAQKERAAAAAAAQKERAAKLAEERKAIAEQVAAAQTQRAEAAKKAQAQQAANAQQSRSNAFAASAAAAQKAKAEAAAAAKKAQAEAAAAAKKAQAEAAAAAKKAQAEAAAAAKKAQAEAAAAAKRAKAEEAAAAKRQREEAAAAARKAKQDAMKAEQERRSQAAAAAKAKPVQKPPALKVAPRGVPTLKNWRRNFDGSVTGLISGSTMFEDGEKITTSEIAKGDISKGTVVQTSSGSKYFLS